MSKVPQVSDKPKDPFKGKHSSLCPMYEAEDPWYEGDEPYCDCMDYYEDWKKAATRVIELERALNLCAAQVGAPDAAEGCRRVIKTVKEVLDVPNKTLG